MKNIFYSLTIIGSLFLAPTLLGMKGFVGLIKFGRTTKLTDYAPKPSSETSQSSRTQRRSKSVFKMSQAELNKKYGK